MRRMRLGVRSSGRSRLSALLPQRQVSISLRRTTRTSETGGRFPGTRSASSEHRGAVPPPRRVLGVAPPCRGAASRAAPTRRGDKREPGTAWRRGPGRCGVCTWRRRLFFRRFLCVADKEIGMSRCAGAQCCSALTFSTKVGNNVFACAKKLPPLLTQSPKEPPPEAQKTWPVSSFPPCHA